jgi:hypothetical protein
MDTPDPVSTLISLAFIWLERVAVSHPELDDRTYELTDLVADIEMDYRDGMRPPPPLTCAERVRMLERLTRIVAEIAPFVDDERAHAALAKARRTKLLVVAGPAGQAKGH